MKKKKSDSRTDHKPIRTRLAGAVLIPSLTLLGMWSIASTYLLLDGYNVRDKASSLRQVSIPAIRALASAQRERQLSMVYLGRPVSGLRDLHAQQQQTDQALAAMRTAARPIMAHATDDVLQRMRNLDDLLEQLPRERSLIDSGGVDRNQVYTFYNSLLDSATSLFETQARLVPDAAAMQGGIEATTLFRASDLMSRATSLASSSFASGTLTPQDHLAFGYLVGSYRVELERSAQYLRPDVRERYQRLVTGDTGRRLAEAEDAIVTRGPWTGRAGMGVPVTEVDWQGLTNQVSQELADLTVAQADEVSAQAVSAGTRKLTGVVAGSVVALLASLAVIVVAMRVSRALVDRALVARLAGLKNDALALAHERLPGIVRRLRNGEPVDVRAELPRLDYGRDEVGQVAEAFNAAHSAAVTATVQEAQARDGVHNVFLGIAHRNQGLVHRQLKLLDTMEREEEDPSQLERLFQLDHLATRARRNAENLVILGGKQPGRRWRRPVPLIDVVRAAISETEHYARVQVENVPAVSITGSAVADTIHLLAELVDNATSFSPPKSPVRVTGTCVAKGVVVEVEDQGLGMSDEDRDRANAMMVAPPEFDAMALKSDSRLGLFVIARLSARLGVTVEFRVSPYGGTRAIVLIPSQVTEQDDGQDSERDGPAEPLPELPRRIPQRRLPAEQRAGGAESPAGAAEPGQRRGAVAVADTEAVPEREGTARPVDWPAGEPEADAPTEAIPDGQAGTAPEGAGDPPALPQRRPQQHIAPQLRNGAPDDTQAAEHGAANDRPAEEVRHTMSAFQRGTAQGRRAGASGDS